jgi:hypothetical protein
MAGFVPVRSDDRIRPAESAVAGGVGQRGAGGPAREPKVAQNGKKPRQISAEDKVMMLS